MITTHVIPKPITISGNPIKTFPSDIQNTLIRAKLDNGAGNREWVAAYEQMSGASKEFMIVLKAGFVPTEQQWNILTHPQTGNFAQVLFKTPKYPGSLIIQGSTKTQTGPAKVAPGAAAPGAPVKESYTAPPRPSKPVVITPYDAIVSKAVNELRPLLKEVDVIKLESICMGDRAGWVSNEDLLKGTPGKQRVIHLCLGKIKDHFKKDFGQPFSITDISQQQKMKEVVKEYIKTVLEHETEHVHQEIEHGGEFGPGAEQKAEKAEDWKKLEEMGIMRKKATLDIIERLDKLASQLQDSDLLKEATELDVISNTLESKLAFDFRSLISKIPGAPQIKDKNQALSIIMDHVKKLGVSKVLAILEDINQNFGKISMEKEAIDLQDFFRKYGLIVFTAAALFLAWTGGLGGTIHQLQEIQKHPQTSQSPLVKSEMTQQQILDQLMPQNS